MQMYCQQVPVWTRSHVRCLLLSCDDRVKTHFAKIGRIFLTVLTHTTQPLLLSYSPNTYHPASSSLLLPLILWSSLLPPSDWWILCILGITRLQQEHKMMSFSIDSVIFITSSCTLTLSELFCWSCHIRYDVIACSLPSRNYVIMSSLPSRNGLNMHFRLQVGSVVHSPWSLYLKWFVLSYLSVYVEIEQAPVLSSTQSVIRKK